MLFLYYPPCSTCKKAKTWLDARSIPYTARHIKDEIPLTKNSKPGWNPADCL